MTTGWHCGEQLKYVDFTNYEQLIYTFFDSLSSRFYFTQTADKLEKPDTDSFMKLHLICLLLDSCFYHAFAIETNWYKI